MDFSQMERGNPCSESRGRKALISVCRNYGAKLAQNATRFTNCKSVAMTQYSTAR